MRIDCVHDLIDYACCDGGSDEKAEECKLEFQIVNFVLALLLGIVRKRGIHTMEVMKLTTALNLPDAITPTNAPMSARPAAPAPIQ